MKLTPNQRRAIRIILEEELLSGPAISPEEAARWIIEVCESPTEAARVVGQSLNREYPGHA